MPDPIEVKFKELPAEEFPGRLEKALSKGQLNAEIPSRLSRYILQDPSRVRGKVITFYSYKGGVGRSRALANVALQLALRGNSVLCIDFDLEAPGLAGYFSGVDFVWNTADPENHTGLMDLFCSYRDSLFRRISSSVVQWSELVQTIKVVKHNAVIDFIGPGRQDLDYKQRVCNFDWRSFYDHWDGGAMIEEFRREVSEKYNYVLVDSRTGITDISGICTVHLPDILVAVFTPGPQSQKGLVDALKCVEANRRELRSQESFHILPLPCRVDREKVREAFDHWFKELLDSYFAEKVSRLAGVWLPADYFRRVAIEHFSRFVYDDTIESLVHNLDDEGGNAWKYRNLIKAIDSVGPIEMSAADLGITGEMHTAKTSFLTAPII